MTHDEFFALQIGADRPPPADKLAEIEQHRQECARCRELEQNHARLRQLVKKIPTSVPPAPDWVDERVMAHVRESVARGGQAPKHPGCRTVAATLVVVALAGTATWRLGFQPKASPAQPTNPLPKEPPREPPKQPPAPPSPPPAESPFRFKDPNDIELGGTPEFKKFKELRNAGKIEEAKAQAKIVIEKSDIPLEKQEAREFLASH
ncbi:MAG TPA: hypothetical protein VFF73_21820 [Planctomycetota bacterium]|nr:hypothetical protein [Planctomycetota bacterium]